MSTEADESGWDVDPEDEASAAIMTAVGRQLKAWREAAGLRAGEFGRLIGYGEDQVYKVESGKRIPKPEYLDSSDEALNAGGKISAMKKDMLLARYPKKIRDLAKLEEEAVELCLYSNHNLHGLLQNEEYTEALIKTWRPVLSPNELERAVAGRMARQSIFDRQPAPELSFVQEEVTLRRPVGGKMVLRRQLERLLEVAQLPHVRLQIMPTDHWDHPGSAGLVEVLKFGNGKAIGRSDGAFSGRPVSDPRQLRILELRYGIIRSQALPSAESLTFIEQVLGET